MEAIDAGIRVIVVIADGVPVQDMMRVKRYLIGHDAVIVGPNTAGVITPGQCKVGIMPADIYQPGPVGVVSRSGTLNYEAVEQMNALGLGQSTALSIGGDPINGCDFITALEEFEKDPESEAVLLIGEIGGAQEVEAAKWAREHMSKPLVAYIAGVSAPPGRRMGHAGAIVSGEADTARAKMGRMAGARNPGSGEPGRYRCDHPAGAGLRFRDGCPVPWPGNCRCIRWQDQVSCTASSFRTRPGIWARFCADPGFPLPACAGQASGG